MRRRRGASWSPVCGDVGLGVVSELADGRRQAQRPCQGATELRFPKASGWGRCTVAAACRASETIRPAEEPSPKICSPRDPCCRFQRARLCHHLYDASDKHRGRVVQTDSLEVSNGVLDGVAAVVGLQFQGTDPVGDEAVIAVGGEEGQYSVPVAYPPDGPHRCGAGLREGGVGGLVAAPSIQRGPASSLHRESWTGQAFVLADVMEKRTSSHDRRIPR